MKIVIATYEHRHGIDVFAFTSLEKAEACRETIARDNWDECGFSKDVEFNVDLYWDEMNDIGTEWFNYDWYEVE